MVVTATTTSQSMDSRDGEYISVYKHFKLHWLFSFLLSCSPPHCPILCIAIVLASVPIVVVRYLVLVGVVHFKQPQ